MTWLIPALKAVLPHVGSIISAAKPVFTRKAPGAEVPPAPLLQEQIAELQAAASQNAANIRELAEQLQKTVVALRRMTWLCAGALAVSIVSICSALYSIFGR
jgi:hypothetical protein